MYACLASAALVAALTVSAWRPLPAGLLVDIVGTAAERQPSVPGFNNRLTRHAWLAMRKRDFLQEWLRCLPKAQISSPGS